MRLILLLFLAIAASAAEIEVMISGGFTAAFLELAPRFERTTGHKVTATFGASMGNAPDSIPVRLERGEHADVIILVASALDELVRSGKARVGSRVDLARSGIAMAVRAGAPKPDIGTVESLKKALLEAKSIAYSASASGVYLSQELFQHLGIADQVLPKSKRIVSVRVGAIVAKGEAEIGFQQLSELLPVKGIEIVGPLPAGAQRITVMSAGIGAHAENAEAGKLLIAFLAAKESTGVIEKSGLEPIATGQ